MATQGRRAGFTLIEVVVVLLIMAVTMAVTVPALLSAPAGEDLDVATRTIESMFRTARDSALRAGVTMTIVIDSASSAVWLVDDAAAAGTTATAGLELPPGVRLQLSRARATFAFAPDGAVFADSLVLRGGVAERLITIDPWTGHVVAQ